MPCRIYESKMTDEDRIAFFTRPGESRPFVMPDPEIEDAGKNFFHDFPAKDQANKGALLEGNDETETVRLNSRAAILLSDIRSWVRATQFSPYDTGHNGSGADSQDNEFLFGTGYGVDMRHDCGPSALHYDKKSKTYRSGLKEKYESGAATKSKLGEPWNPGKPVVLKVATNDLGQEIKFLYQVGHIKNLDFGQERDPSIKEGFRWRKYETAVTVPRGEQIEEPLSTGALVIPSKSKVDRVSDTESTNRGTASNFAPASVYTASGNERDHAHEQLDRLTSLITPKMYDALIAAAEGDTFEEIGRRFMPGLSSTDRRPGVKGKTLVIDALELLILKDFRNAA